ERAAADRHRRAVARRRQRGQPPRVGLAVVVGEGEKLAAGDRGGCVARRGRPPSSAPHERQLDATTERGEQVRKAVVLAVVRDDELEPRRRIRLPRDRLDTATERLRTPVGRHDHRAGRMRAHDVGRSGGEAYAVRWSSNSYTAWGAPPV